MNLGRHIVFVGCLIFLAGCGSADPVACTSEGAQAPAVAIVKEQLEKEIDKQLKRDDGTRAVGLSKIRAAIAQLAISIEDIRTSKVDPNSTKRFCTGNLQVKFPVDVLTDAEKARELAEMGTVDDLADGEDIDRSADKFSTDIDFNVQPTDDGSKVFAELESGNNMLKFASEVLASGLVRSLVEDHKRQEAEEAQALEDAQNAALAEQQAANLNSAKTDNQLAVQTLTAVWQAIPSEARQRLLPLQRAWIRKKDADCRVEAASASIESTEREVARLNCDTRISRERTGALSQFREEYEAANWSDDSGT